MWPSVLSTPLKPFFLPHRTPQIDHRAESGPSSGIRRKNARYPFLLQAIVGNPRRLMTGQKRHLFTDATRAQFIYLQGLLRRY